MATSARASLHAIGPRPATVHQRGAYGIVQDDRGRLLVVRTVNGRCYLPGGRIEPGEQAPGALAREIAEECGWAAEVAEQLLEAGQPIFAGRVQLAATYWRARLVAPLGGCAEHDMLWLDPCEARARLHRASDRQALRAVETGMVPRDGIEPPTP